MFVLKQAVDLYDFYHQQIEACDRQLGIKPDEFDAMAKNARDTMGGLFMCDPCELTQEECASIYEKSYK